MDNRMDAVIYCRGVDRESEVLREHLEDLGIDARMRNVDADPGALREWERLDGEVTPLLVLDRRSIVRGLDRTRVDQLVGWIGC
jgi:hypothetical protein